MRDEIALRERIDALRAEREARGAERDALRARVARARHETKQARAERSARSTRGSLVRMLRDALLGAVTTSAVIVAVDRCGAHEMRWHPRVEASTLAALESGRECELAIERLEEDETGARCAARVRCDGEPIYEGEGDCAASPYVGPRRWQGVIDYWDGREDDGTPVLVVTGRGGEVVLRSAENVARLRPVVPDD
ncbi:MAG: hypothetical protein IT378_14410 [Sandaracinaceae bacterium]|nr:hypothetical protein [Sandaracinaceae bacterium]